MENIITDILKIEADAQKRLTDADQEGIRILTEAKIQRDNIINSRIHEVQKKIDEFNLNEKNKAEKRIAEIERQGLKEISDIDNIYSLNHLKWEENIFNEIINS